MNTRTIAILGGAAAAAVGIAALVSRGGTTETEAAALFEGLMPRINDISIVHVKRSDGELSIRRAGEGWELVEKGGFPVRIDRVRETVVGLAELRAAQPMTSREDRYAQIGVQDPENAEAGAAGGPTLLTLKDDGGKVLAATIVGNSRYGARPGVYIRRPGEAQSWLAEGRLEVPGQFTGWVEAQIMSIPRERVKSVDITPRDGDPFSVERENREQKNFTVLGVPHGREVTSTTAADAFGSALSFLSLEDVAPAGSIDFAGKEKGAPGSQLEFRTFDGLLVMLQLADQDGRTWARIAALPDPDAEPEQAVIDEAAELNAKVERWAYGLPPYKASVMKVTMADLLQDGRPELPASMMEEGIEIHSLDPDIPPPGPFGNPPPGRP